MSIEMRDVRVAFGGIRALDGISITVEPGQVLALIGPNGAGKSTAMNVMSGFVTPTSGEVVLDGAVRRDAAPHKRSRDGLGRTFQTPRMLMDATLLDNVLAGCYPQIRGGLLAAVLRLPPMRADEHEVTRRAVDALGRVGLGDHLHEPAGNVPIWMLRLAEVARSVVSAPRYLLLDEPAAGLDEDAMGRLGGLIRSLAADGIGVLLVEHHFSLVRQLSDHVMVLDRGRHLTEGDAGSVERDPRVIETYLGSAADA